jgi:outer membrane lipoprotein carrier protein
MKSLSFLCCILLLAVPALGAPAPAGTQVLQGAAAAAKMRSLLGGRPNIEARFTQSVFDARGAVVQRSAGRFTAQQPRQLHWQVQSPAPQTLVTDGKRVWLHDPDLQQVTVDTLDALTAEAPMLVLSGQVDSLLTRFDLTGEGSGRDWTFRLRVRPGVPARGPGFQAIALRVAAGDVQSMQVEDSLSQRTELAFSDVRHPARVDPALFRFTVPPGTEIVER